MKQVRTLLRTCIKRSGVYVQQCGADEVWIRISNYVMNGGKWVWLYEDWNWYLCCCSSMLTIMSRLKEVILYNIRWWNLKVPIFSLLPLYSAFSHSKIHKNVSQVAEKQSALALKSISMNHKTVYFKGGPFVPQTQLNYWWLICKIHRSLCIISS